MAGLPDEVEALRALLTESRQATRALEAEIRALRRRLASLERAPLQRATGSRIAGAQLEFPLERTGDVVTPPEPEPAAAREVGRSLRRESVVLPPSSGERAAHCSACGAALEEGGADVSQLLEYSDGEYRLIEYRRPRVYCPTCRQWLQAPPPLRPIPRALPGPGLLAHLIASRYERQLPLYRQAQLGAAAGMSLDRSTLADWLEASWLLLEPLVDALARHVLAGSHLQASSVAYPIRAHGTGRRRIGRLWLYLRDERPWGSPVPPAAWLRFTADRSGAQARAHLAGFAGTLQGPAVDEEPVYHAARIERLGCWAELRARIAKAGDSAASGMVEELLQRIDALYQIERTLCGRSSEARRTLRLERSRPLLDALQARLRACLRELPKRAELSGAIRFALARWHSLERYSEDGRAEMDGLAAQQLLLATVGERVGRGTDTHGARAAALYGLIATARLNGAEPERYLRWLLERLGAQVPPHWEALLPWARPDS